MGNLSPSGGERKKPVRSPAGKVAANGLLWTNLGSELLFA
jgi:hypothetical protein